MTRQPPCALAAQGPVAVGRPNRPAHNALNHAWALQPRFATTQPFLVSVLCYLDDIGPALSLDITICIYGALPTMRRPCSGFCRMKAQYVSGPAGTVKCISSCSNEVNPTRVISCSHMLLPITL